jgi:hypothetical protein
MRNLFPKNNSTDILGKDSDIVKKEEEGTLRQIAYRAFLVEKSWEKLKEAVDYVQNNVKYYDKTGKSMIVSFFDSKILNSYDVGAYNHETEN